LRIRVYLGWAEFAVASTNFNPWGVKTLTITDQKSSDPLFCRLTVKVRVSPRLYVSLSVERPRDAIESAEEDEIAKETIKTPK